MGTNARRVTRIKPTDILEELETHMAWLDEDYSLWCCGITADPESTHRQVGPAGTEWKCLDAGTELDARQIEILLRFNGCQVARHLGGDEAHYIFVYWKPGKAST